MQMRSRHITRSAAFGDKLPLIHPASDTHAQLTEMRVIGLVTVIVLDLDKIPISAEPPGMYHLTAIRGVDRGTARCSQIHPEMEIVFPV